MLEAHSWVSGERQLARGRALAAARAAIASPLLEASIDGARGILLTIAGSSDLGLFEVNEAAEIIHDVAHAEAKHHLRHGRRREPRRRDPGDGHRRRLRPIRGLGSRQRPRGHPRRAGSTHPRSRKPSRRHAPTRKVAGRRTSAASATPPPVEPEVEIEETIDLFDEPEDDLDDEFDVPSFLK